MGKKSRTKEGRFEGTNESVAKVNVGKENYKVGLAVRHAAQKAAKQLLLQQVYTVREHLPDFVTSSGGELSIYRPNTFASEFIYKASKGDDPNEKPVLKYKNRELKKFVFEFEAFKRDMQQIKDLNGNYVQLDKEKSIFPVRNRSLKTCDDTNSVLVFTHPFFQEDYVQAKIDSLVRSDKSRDKKRASRGAIKKGEESDESDDEAEDRKPSSSVTATTQGRTSRRALKPVSYSELNIDEDGNDRNEKKRSKKCKSY